GALHFEHPETAADQPHAVPNSDTRLRLTAGACNETMSADRAIITLRSFLTGDVERVTATETDPNNGVFLTAAVPMARMDVPVSGDNVIATTDGDRLIATADCAGAALQDELLITPGNFLFNALTNEPIGDVAIALMDMNSGAEMARRMTDARGFFSFGDMPAGEYQYAVMNAPAWDVPSVRADFPGFNRRVAGAGYMASFRHAGGMLDISDIPADPHYGVPLALDKQADKDMVGAGEFVVYTLNFTNNMNQALIGAEIMDRPAFGSQLVAGSVTFNGETMEDPAVDASGDMTYDLGMLTPLSSHELTYVMQFTAAAREGRNENTAVLTGRQAGTGTVMQSQTARAMVKLNNSGGVFAREATVIGS
ncbi:MAG: carboxypeptidase-like regulatory domain-containing protein, partial [Roseibium sp.]